MTPERLAMLEAEAAKEPEAAARLDEALSPSPVAASPGRRFTRA